MVRLTGQAHRPKKGGPKSDNEGEGILALIINPYNLLIWKIQTIKINYFSSLENDLFPTQELENPN